MLEQPLLDTLSERTAGARPGDLYHEIAERLGLSLEERATTRTCANQSYNVFEQQVRWTRQTLVAKGLVGSPRGTWQLTDEGRAKVQRIARGQIVLVYSLDDGLAFLAHAEDAAQIIEPESLSLILTSPPYPLIKREYGRLSLPEWMEWMHRLVGLWRDLLREDGTLAVNLMDVHVPGSPTLSTYVERFTLDCIDRHGFHLAGRMPWHSPTKLASLEWAVKRGHQLRNSVEHVILLSRSPNPAWDATRVEREPYAARSAAQRRSDAARGREIRPSGLDLRAGAFTQNSGGRLASNLLVAGGASGNSHYARRCREAGLAPHPARFPDALPRRVIQLATAPGEIVYDPMAGSNTTGKVALELGRRFISSEPIASYVEASTLRFDHLPDFHQHAKP